MDVWSRLPFLFMFPVDLIQAVSPGLTKLMNGLIARLVLSNMAKGFIVRVYEQTFDFCRYNSVVVDIVESGDYVVVCDNMWKVTFHLPAFYNLLKK